MPLSAPGLALLAVVLRASWHFVATTFGGDPRHACLSAVRAVRGVVLRAPPAPGLGLGLGWQELPRRGWADSGFGGPRMARVQRDRARRRGLDRRLRVAGAVCIAAGVSAPAVG